MPAQDDAGTAGSRSLALVTAESDVARLGPVWGAALLVVGLVDMVALPFTPFGIPLMAAGVLVLAPHSRTFRRIDGWVEGRLPQFRRRAAHLTQRTMLWSGRFQQRFQKDLRRRFP